ncbi:MAG: ABC transporter substrate-binding protein [Clostridiales bacterium]|nr:ABC transporter substrate-binding protein [Clostridiales bacterium]
MAADTGGAASTSAEPSSGVPLDSAASSPAANRMQLDYATQFQVDYLDGGCALISVTDSGRFLFVPEGCEPPEDTGEGVTLLRGPVTDIYLAATSAMCLFDALGSLGSVTMTGTKAEGWYIENARAAMERGEIAYAGRYGAPDYELLISKNCRLAIESTMISHVPEVKEKLEELGIPVLVERSSYEPHPLGRTEWIKLYGLLTGKEELALKIFNEQAEYLKSIPGEKTGKTAAFFYISSSGGAVARKPGDYAAKMIELAGGNYVFSDIGDNGEGATGSVNLEMEIFYEQAKDADFIIYNSSIDGEVRSVDELLAKSHLIGDFKAVKSGDVWCTGKNLFQDTTGFGLMISDMHKIFTGNTEGAEELNYLFKLQ